MLYVTHTSNHHRSDETCRGIGEYSIIGSRLAALLRFMGDTEEAV